MNENKGLHLLYKNLGETPNERILRFKKDNPEYRDTPVTYAGRLDPMAEGLLLVLSGDGIKEKDKYLDLKKTYEAEILWGFETDTLDILGMVSVSSFSTYSSKDTDIFLLKPPYRSSTPFAFLKRSRFYEVITSLLTSSSLRRASLVPSQNMISTNLQTLIGKFEQKYPAYSSKPVQGKPLFQWVREGKLREVEIPNHEVEIFDVDFVERTSISGKELLENIIQKTSLVLGDFRQEDILNKWKEVLSKREEADFIIDKIKISVSSGFYVRQFVSDLATRFGTVATTLHIKRTSIGDYSIAESIK